MAEIPETPIAPESMFFSSHVDFGWFVVFQLEDSGGNKSSLTYELQTVGNVLDPATAIYNALLLVTSAAITRFVIEFRFNPPSYVEAESYSQVEAKAKLRVKDEVLPGDLHTMYIPSPRPEIFLTSDGDGANVVNPNNVNLLAFLDEFIDGGNGKLPNGRFIDGFHSGVRVTRKSKRG